MGCCGVERGVSNKNLTRGIKFVVLWFCGVLSCWLGRAHQKLKHKTILFQHGANDKTSLKLWAYEGPRSDKCVTFGGVFLRHLGRGCVHLHFAFCVVHSGFDFFFSSSFAWVAFGVLFKNRFTFHPFTFHSPSTLLAHAHDLQAIVPGGNNDPNPPPLSKYGANANPLIFWRLRPSPPLPLPLPPLFSAPSG